MSNNDSATHEREHRDTRTESEEPQHNRTTPMFTVGNRAVSGDTLLKLFGVGWVVVISWLFNGFVGIGVSLIIGLVTLVSRPVVVVGIAHAGLLGLYPEVTTFQPAIELALFEIGIIAILLSDPPIARIDTILTVTLSLTFATIFFELAGRSGYVTAMGILLFMILLIAYIIHRYEQVALGLAATESKEKPNS